MYQSNRTLRSALIQPLPRLPTVHVTENVTVAQVTYELMRLSNFLSQVSDDHNYVMDVREDGSPVVCIDGSTAYFLGTISPHSLLEVLRPIVYGAAPPAP